MSLIFDLSEPLFVFGYSLCMIVSCFAAEGRDLITGRRRIYDRIVMSGTDFPEMCYVLHC